MLAVFVVVVVLPPSNFDLDALVLGGVTRAGPAEVAVVCAGMRMKRRYMFIYPRYFFVRSNRCGCLF